MTVRVRKVETGAVVGVSEIVAEGLLVSDEFERVDDPPVETEQKPARAPRKRATPKK